ncbi:MAG: hypothetical protein ACYC6N_19785 [Pirellulaceae bacterium]
MFGKPEWFRKKKVGWGLDPVSWKGWLYTALWAAAIAVPFVGLLISHLWLEALVWSAVMMAALLWDVRQVRRDMDVSHVTDVPLDRNADPPHQDVPDILVIDEHTEPDPSYYATRSYDLRTRRP